MTAAVIAAVACRTKPPETLERPQRWVPDEEPRTIGDDLESHRIHLELQPPPAFDPEPFRPDPTHEVLRWPLSGTEHPVLAPRYDVASALADPGIDWTELCRRGAHKRVSGGTERDALSYLGAWCAVATRDLDTALAALARLRGSTVKGVAAAISIDIATILVDTGDAAHASVLLNRYGLIDPDLLDVLAALYADLDRHPDAFEINERAIGADPGMEPDKTCRRKARRVVLQPESYRARVVGSSGLFATPDTSRICVALEAELRCWLDLERCASHFKLVGIDPGYVSVTTAQRQWHGAYSHHDWIRIADHAIDGAPLPLAIDTAITAFENARARAVCAWERELLRESSARLRARSGTLDAQREQRLQNIENSHPPERCNRKP